MLPYSHVVPINNAASGSLHNSVLLADAFSEFIVASSQLEARRRGDVTEGLVGSLGVVVAHPVVEGDLGLLERVEGVELEEFSAHRAVQSLDLAGRRG